MRTEFDFDYYARTLERSGQELTLEINTQKALSAQMESELKNRQNQYAPLISLNSKMQLSKTITNIENVIFVIGDCIALARTLTKK